MITGTPIQPASTPADIAVQIKAFTDRADRLRKEASKFLWIIIVSLLVGGLGFVFAGFITDFDFKSQEAMRQKAELRELIVAKEKERTAVEELLQPLDGYQAQFTSAVMEDGYSSVRIDFFAENTASPHSADSIVMVAATIDEIILRTPMGMLYAKPRQSFATLDAARAAGEELVVRLKTLDRVTAAPRDIRRHSELRVKRFDLDDDLESLKARELSLYANISANPGAATTDTNTAGRPAATASDLQPAAPSKAAQPAPIDWPRTVQTNLTRFGGILVIIFLVRVLLPQYRYNLKLSAFYDAIADAYRSPDLGGTAKERIDALVPRVEFGENPTTPLEQVVDIIKAVKGATDGDSKAVPAPGSSSGQNVRPSGGPH